METWAHVSSIQNIIHMPVPGVRSPVEGRSCSESSRCCVHSAGANPFLDGWVMAEWLGCCSQQWAAEGVFEILRSALETAFRLAQQFAHSGNLPCYQFTETCSYVSSIQNDIYPWVTSLADWQSQISRFMGPTWSAPGSCRPQMGPMSAPWTLLSGTIRVDVSHDYKGTCRT